MKLPLEWIVTALFSIRTLTVLAFLFRTPSIPTSPHLEKHHGETSAIAAPPIDSIPSLGPSFDEDASLPAHAVSIASYTLQANLDTRSHVIEGKGTIHWVNRSSTSITELPIHLYANAFRNEASRFLSDRRPGGRGTQRIRDFGFIDVLSFVVSSHGNDNLWPKAIRADSAFPSDDTDMLVPLERPVAAGESIDIEVAWRTKLPSIVERMGYHDTFHMAAQWYPKIAKHESDGRFAHFSFDRLSEFYADFGTYDITISVPSTFLVGATGPCVSDIIEGDRRIVRHVQADIHDFAFAAWDGFREVRRQVDGIDVRLLFPPGYERVATEQLDVTTFGLRYYGKRFGSYPYAMLTIVHPPSGAGEAGGMEYPTLFTTGGSWWERGPNGMARSVTLHELAHQYFQGMVATNEATWPMLDEGITSFVELDALDTGWPDAGAFSLSDYGVSAATMARWFGLTAGTDDIIAKPAAEFSSGHAYARLVYWRSALLWRTLDRVFDGTIMQALGRYARRYRFTHPEPEHLLSAVRDVAGKQAEDALRISLFERGWIDVAINDAFCGSLSCQAIVSRRGNLELPVDVLWIHTDGSRVMTRWEGKEVQTTLHKEGLIPVRHIVLDPEHKILLDDDLSNNAIFLGQRPRAWRTRSYISYLAILGLQAVMP
ncbi:MAG TPA: M1 family metallopeptidase [Polyangiaceae bacterium]|nr:M1 family metallopeptidase [Polyangiaceae bacterium]